MPRIAQPYNQPASDTGYVVGDTPTRATGRRYGQDALIGIDTKGTLAGVVPINAPWAGQGALFPAFPFVQPSSVAPNIIRPALLVARNLFSPIHHSTDASTQTGVPAIPAGGITGSNAPSRGRHSVVMPRKQNRTNAALIPVPPNFPNWPDIMQRMVR